MFPIRDHNQADITPFVTYALIAVNTLIFLAMVMLSPPQLQEFYQEYALVPAEILRFEELYTLLSSMFLHGSFGHLFGNMLFLNIFGNNLESAYGHFKFFIFYIIAGFGASFLQIITSVNSTIPVLGASGAIAGVMGGYLALFPNHKIEVIYSFGFLGRRQTVPAYFMLFYWFLAQFLYGVGDLAASSGGGVAYLAHVGGFITGFVITRLLEDILDTSDVPEPGIRGRIRRF
jgi:membrane associated rhomboid family serine protease